MRKLKILFRWYNDNRYTLSALTGLLDETLKTTRCDIRFVENKKEISAHAGKGTAPILAYSFSTLRAAGVLAEIRSLKNTYGDALTIICGGPHASAMPRQVLAAGADAVFIGEAERSLPGFLERFHGTGTLPETGIIPSLPVDDLDDYPPFARRYDFFAPIEIRRGCPSGCAFCQTPRLCGKERERSVEYVLKHARYIRRAGREHIMFTAPDALAYGAAGSGVNTSVLDELLGSVKELGLKPRFGVFPSEISPRRLVSCPQAADVLKKHVSNVKMAVGGQSGSERMLRLMRRPHTLKDVTDSVRILRGAGFTPVVDILFGVPGETSRDRQATVKYMQRLFDEYRSRFNVHYFIPLPGTPLWGKPPSRIEDDIKKSVMKMISDGTARGDFLRQIDISGTIHTGIVDGPFTGYS